MSRTGRVDLLPASDHCKGRDRRRPDSRQHAGIQASRDRRREQILPTLLERPVQLESRDLCHAPRDSASVSTAGTALSGCAMFRDDLQQRPSRTACFSGQWKRLTPAAFSTSKSDCVLRGRSSSCSDSKTATSSSSCSAAMISTAAGCPSPSEAAIANFSQSADFVIATRSL